MGGSILGVRYFRELPYTCVQVSPCPMSYVGPCGANGPYKGVKKENSSAGSMTPILVPKGLST